MKFDRVRKEEADTVLKLYRSLLGTPYCVWTEDYPTEKEVEFDFYFSRLRIDNKKQVFFQSSCLLPNNFYR